MRWAAMAATRYRWARSRSRGMTGRCRYGSWDREWRDQMQRRYITVDVFTDRAFGGNPLAVVLDAGGLSAAQMQVGAIEVKYRQTDLVVSPRAGAVADPVRRFSVNTEPHLSRHANYSSSLLPVIAEV